MDPFTMSAHQPPLRSSLVPRAVRSIIGTLEYDEVISDRNRINDMLTKVIGNSIEKWSIVCTKVEIQFFGPMNRDVECQLEKQMAAERDRRQQELNTRAQINIAGGRKQSAILESEGLLTSNKNKAEADYVSVVRQADAVKYQIEMETEAFTRQIKRLKEELDNNSDLVVNYLVALKRYKELEAIATGKNNTVYFMNRQDHQLQNSLPTFLETMRQHTVPVENWVNKTS